MEVIQSAPNGVGDSGIPSGCILMWSGSIDTIPNGWKLCDGSNGTPDRRNRFIVGAGSGYSPGNTGGSNNVTLETAHMPSHSHSGSTSITIKTSGGSGGGPNRAFFYAGFTSSDSNTLSGSITTSSVGSSSAHENRPPYYALCFIMKL